IFTWLGRVLWERFGPPRTCSNASRIDYLFRDCALVTTWLSKSFVVDLPEDARQAPVESVTLPQALNLDDFQLDDDTHEGEFDNHLRSQEDITLTDQIPTGVDPYVAITFDVGH
ncbi:unnamed protein product, partial [Brassica oleracea]